MPKRWARIAAFAETAALVAATFTAAPALALAQSQQRPPAAANTARTPTAEETAMLKALAGDPRTAPFAFTTSVTKQGRVVLGGRVSSKVIHDIAVRIAMTATPSFDDQLVIDTSVQPRNVNAPGPNQQPVMVGLTPAGFGLASNVPYVYPPPIFNYLDEPFYGFEPPIISYPPWWGQMSARRIRSLIEDVRGPQPSTAPGQPPAPAGDSSGRSGSVEMTIDGNGVATLRGSVPTLADKRAVGERLGRSPGVLRVINLLTTRDGSDADPAAAIQPVDNNVPPPPAPAPGPPPQAAAPAPAPAAAPIAARDSPMNRKLADALAKRPALAGAALRAVEDNGVAHLSGKVPTALEAMLAFRAVQQTPGIRDVVDQLQFDVPPVDGRNPLLDKGRPEDVEPYLEAQIKRQAGDSAHIDRVRLNGDRLEVKGTVPRADDKPRIEALLRSIPVLRGFTIVPNFQAE